MQQQRLPMYPTDDNKGATALYATKAEYSAARNALLNTLRKLYPDHFSTSCRPWAVGLREAVINELCNTHYPVELITHTLNHFTTSVNYRTNCVLHGIGTPRLRLDGQTEGELTRQDLIYALNQLSGLIRRRDPVQAAAYREWALREMVLGLLRGDITDADLIHSRVKLKVIRKAQLLSVCPETPQRLKLRHRRTGELHPAIYAAPHT